LGFEDGQGASAERERLQISFRERSELPTHGSTRVREANERAAVPWGRGMYDGA